MEEEEGFSHYSEDDVRRIYPILRAMAGQRMAFERPGNTLQPTALAHEAWLRMRSDDDRSWKNTAHFFTAAAETMRRILIDRARRRNRPKHAGDLDRVPMIAAEDEATENKEPMLQVNAALEKLKKVNPPRAQVVLLKFFGGLTNQEIAEEMGVTERTVERYWAYSKSWLFREIQGQR
ncbi:ECF-type sigma factor [Luteolibacter marinus]|uniref:ECF-type sigma factor n=1 Tax=Luteolibacter marinus TaxID=2776705 RepID=UPI001866B453|nr:ECF-type sigma factor [Luteolibacter marinus]